jgi:protein-tyrosine phosphatase
MEPMAKYQLSWITDSLAMGHAPMSFTDLDSIREQGVQSIVNLCGEFCDLHDIENQHGFEVYYLPVCDNAAPTEPELEKALDWLDEVIYLGKKVLVHCRYGVGRTATFVASYLLRKGFGLKIAKEKVEEARSMQSSYSQWKLLRKYSKKSGSLTIREPSLENRRTVDLSPFFNDHESLLAQVDELFFESAAKSQGPLRCGLETDGCCYEFVELSFVEAAYLNHKLNQTLPAKERKDAIERAVQAARRTKEINRAFETGTGQPTHDRQQFASRYRESRILCPLSVDARCVVYPFRPIACRIYGLAAVLRGRRTAPPADDLEGKGAADQVMIDQVRDTLTRISANILHALSAVFLKGDELTFSLVDTVSGRFVQKYFESLSRLQDPNLAPSAEQSTFAEEQEKRDA